MIKEVKWKNLLLAAFWCFALIQMAFFLPEQARAEFPERAITIIVGNEAGATTDILTRSLAIGAGRAAGKPIIVENRGGGGGAVALGVLSNAKADGYTLCAVPNDALVVTPLMQQVPFKPLKSFTPIIAHSASERPALLVKSDSPWKTLNDFLDYAKKNPGKVKYSTAGVGSTMHLAMEYIAHKDGIKWTHIPFKGTAPARTALMGGHVDLCSSGVDWVPYAQAGTVRALAVPGRTRSPDFPNIPTLKELGYDFASDTIHGIVAPAGLPADVAMKLEVILIKGTETPEFKTAQERVSVTPVLYNSKEFDRHLKAHWVKMEKLLKDTGIIKEGATQPY